MTTELSTIPREIIDCIAQGREPRSGELFIVANHIWSDLYGSCASPATGGAQAGFCGHISYRAARTALSGSA